MSELKIIIEKKKQGVNCDIKGENIENEIVTGILLKVLFNFCKATALDIEDLLDKLSKD